MPHAGQGKTTVLSVLCDFTGHLGLIECPREPHSDICALVQTDDIAFNAKLQRLYSPRLNGSSPPMETPLLFKKVENSGQYKTVLVLPPIPIRRPEIDGLLTIVS